MKKPLVLGNLLNWSDEFTFPSFENIQMFSMFVERLANFFYLTFLVDKDRTAHLSPDHSISWI